MPGYYWQGDTDLGHHLQFRSLIGFGWTLSPQQRGDSQPRSHLERGSLQPQSRGGDACAALPFVVLIDPERQTRTSSAMPLHDIKTASPPPWRRRAAPKAT
jgi:hypothetical protein